MKKSSKLKSALVAVGGSLAAVPATAIELGEVKVHSSLGQPLRASIAYALAPNEQIYDTCVTIPKRGAADAMPSVGATSIIVADGVIAITGRSAVREPLLSMRVNIRCPYTAQLTRDYTMFIDPVNVEPAAAAAPTTEPTAAPAAVTRPTPRPEQPVTRRRPVNTEPIANATRYRVQPGDSLSEIAQRIQDRPIGLWPAVNAIFEANPDAFIDSDPNKLKAGSWLDIPDFGAGAPLTVAEAPAASTESPAPQAAPVEPVGESAPYEPPATAYEPPAAEEAPLIEAPSVIEEPVVTESADAESPAADLAPGDIILDSDNPFVDVEAPEATSSSPNVPVAVIRTSPAEEPESTNWLMWLGGAGMALILGLLLFGRRLRDRFGSTPIVAVETPRRRKTDHDTEVVEAIGDVDVDLPDDSPTQENLALDADLVVGTGLTESTDVDIAQDFAFAQTTTVDIELPEEMSSGQYEKPETDIIPPLNVDNVESILESEVLPQSDDDEYDMSVIVDATQMPHPDDVTEKDLEAIQVDDGDETLITEDYTLSQEADYKILEQDYEDELTATQALNAEIQKAADELASRMEGDGDDDKTATSMATVHELDVTAQLRGRNDDDIGDDDDTGINPTVNIEGDDKTVEMMEDSTVEMTDDKTVEMVEDNTIEMPKKGKTG